VAIKKALEPFLPTPVVITKSDGTLAFDYTRPQSVGRVRAFYGNFGMFVRALAYIQANGPDGLRQTTEDAVLNANYIRHRLEGTYDLPYSTPTMHEVVFSDKLQAKKGVRTMDIAKRLIDYGFHPYTTAFPLIVPGALMIEPTESESKEELDRFCDALISIREEIREIEDGRAQRDNNLLTNAPHTMEQVISDSWNRPYPRERAGYPSASVREHKVWPTVGRVDSAFGDRNLVCSCPPVEAYG
jgi:glycine dehydrogenase subunit 2